MSKEVESIKAKKETREKLAKIRNKSEWLEKEANKTFALMDLSVKDLDSKPERWITIPLKAVSYTHLTLPTNREV